MKNSKTVVKALALALLAAAVLSGCVAVPYGPPGYGPQAYGPQAYSAPVVVVPWFGFGGRGHRGGHGRW